MGTETLEPGQNHPQPCALWKGSPELMVISLSNQKSKLIRDS